MKKNIELVIGIITLIIIVYLVVQIIIQPSPPIVDVITSYYDLRMNGYNLVINLSSTKTTYLRYVQFGDKYVEYIHKISPPYTLLIIPTDNLYETVRLHIEQISPITIHPVSLIPNQSEVSIVKGKKYIYAVGTLTENKNVIISKVKSFSRELLVVFNEDKYSKTFFDYYSRMMKLNITSITVEQLTWPILENFSNIVFVDVYPDSAILKKLVDSGKRVFLVSYYYSLGEYKITFINNTFIVIHENPEKSDIEYFYSHCTINVGKVEELENASNVSLIIHRYFKSFDYTHGILKSSYCLSQFEEVFVETKSTILFGKTRYFYLSFLDPRILLLYYAVGFFEKNTILNIFNISAFFGVKPLIEYDKRYEYIIVIPQGKYNVSLYYFTPPPADYTIIGNRVTVSLGSIGENVIWEGEADIILQVFNYKFSLKNTITRHVVLPTNIAYNYSRDYFYVVYVNETPVLVIADENTLTSKPRIRVDYSSLWETFFMIIRREDNGNNTLLVFVNGENIGNLTNTIRKLSVDKAEYPVYQLVVRDLFGNIVYEKTITITHIYENVFFIISLVLVVGIVSSFIILVKVRLKKRIDKITIKVYEIEETRKELVDPNTIYNFIVNKYNVLKIPLKLSDVLEYFYRQGIDHLNDAVKSLEVLIRRKQLKIVSRYVRELDDVLSVISLPRITGKRIVYEAGKAVKDFYKRILHELSLKFGVEYIGYERVEFVPADILAYERNLLMVSFITREEDIAKTINALFSNFVIYGLEAKLRLKVKGFAIITREDLVPTINIIIDKILEGNETFINKYITEADKISQVISYPKKKWLENNIFVAVPYTRLSVLIAGFKVKNYEFVNTYYRSLYY